jgi:hypothetical protein
MTWSKIHSILKYTSNLIRSGKDLMILKRKITGGMRSTPTPALEVMFITHLFIKLEVSQAAYRLLGNECS